MLRYVFFVPGAFLIAILSTFLLSSLLSLLGTFGQLLGHILGGYVGGAFFLMFGLEFAPEKSEATKYFLIVLGIFGAILYAMHLNKKANINEFEWWLLMITPVAIVAGLLRYSVFPAHTIMES